MHRLEGVGGGGQGVSHLAQGIKARCKGGAGRLHLFEMDMVEIPRGSTQLFALPFYRRRHSLPVWDENKVQ